MGWGSGVASSPIPWKNNTVPLVTVSSGVHAEAGLFLGALQQTSLLNPVSSHSHVLEGPFDLLRRGSVALAEPKHESEIVHVFRDLPGFFIPLLSAASNSGTVQHFVLEKSIFLFSFNVLL